MSFESTESMNLKPLNASQPGAAAEQQFLSHGTIRHIDIAARLGIVRVVEAMTNMHSAPVTWPAPGCVEGSHRPKVGVAARAGRHRLNR